MKHKKLRQNKKGVELSINFIVMLVLAIAVFSGGLLFINKFFSEAEEIRLNIDAQTERQIANLLDDGSPFVVPIRTLEVQNGKFVQTAAGIFNNGAAQDSSGAPIEEFTLTVRLHQAWTIDNQPLCNGLDTSGCTSDPNSWVITDSNAFQIKEGSQGTRLIGFDVDNSANRGNYIYKAALDSSWSNLAGYEEIQIVLQVR